MKPTDFLELCQLIRRDARQRVSVATACEGKDRFATYLEAASTMRRELRRVAAPYHCYHCSYWHIGNRTANRQKRLVEERRRA